MATATLELLIKLRDEASAGLSSIGGSLGSIGGWLAGGALAVGTAGILALGGAIGAGISEAAEAQEGLAQLQAVIASTGGKAGMTADAVLDLSSKLSAANGLSKFSDDAVLSANNLLLTFTNIGKDVFPAAAQAAVDMAQSLGGDPVAQATALGKALNDPIAGVTALGRVGVTFTQQQKDVIKSLVETGDVAAAQKVILAELASEFGGSAATAAQTFSGQKITLWEKFSGVLEGVGAALLPAIQQVVAGLSSPAVFGAIQDLADGLTIGLGGAIAWVQSDGVPMLTAAWAAIEPTIATVGAWFETAIPAAISALNVVWSTVLMPIFAALGTVITTEIGPALGELIGWIGTDLLGAGSSGAGAWSTYLLPALTALSGFLVSAVIPGIGLAVHWLREELPIAFAAVAAYWSSTLEPALVAAYGYFAANILPILKEVVTEVETNLPRGIQVVADYWTGTLQPALVAVWSYLDANVIPLLVALGRVYLAAIVIAVTDAAKGFQDYLLPAIVIIGEKGIWLATNVLDGISKSFGYISTAIKDATAWLNTMADQMNAIEVPAWLQGHSPPPMANWFGYIADAASQVNVQLPALTSRLDVAVAVPIGRPAAPQSTSAGPQSAGSAPVVINIYMPSNGSVSLADAQAAGKAAAEAWLGKTGQRGDIRIRTGAR